jgi:MSHA biogenesis protein MshJ
MKQRLIELGNKVDALSLRERVMVFAAVAAAIVFVANALVFEPMLAKQKALRAQISLERNNAMAIDAQLVSLVQAHTLDPDAAERARLDAVTAEAAQLGAALRSTQRGLVAPDKMVALLESLLKGRGGLRLLSLKTLPVSGLSEGAFNADAASDPAPAATTPLQAAAPGTMAALKAAAPAKAELRPAAKAPELLYRHGVELTLQGAYPDMLDYMAALEAMPSQLFWAKAKLEAEDYPRVRLTLVLYTLSLDQKWIAL